MKKNLSGNLTSTCILTSGVGVLSKEKDRLSYIVENINVRIFFLLTDQIFLCFSFKVFIYFLMAPYLLNITFYFTIIQRERANTR
jgi:hypothetical protein